MGSVSNKPSAVLWDMDGTLVDTEPYWMDAETVLVESFGGTRTLKIGDAGVVLDPGVHTYVITSTTTDALNRARPAAPPPPPMAPQPAPPLAMPPAPGPYGPPPPAAP